MFVTIIKSWYDDTVWFTCNTSVTWIIIHIPKCMTNTAVGNENCNQFSSRILACAVKRKVSLEVEMITTSDETSLLIVHSWTRQKSLSVFCYRLSTWWTGREVFHVVLKYTCDLDYPRKDAVFSEELRTRTHSSDYFRYIIAPPDALRSVVRC